MLRPPWPPVSVSMLDIYNAPRSQSAVCDIHDLGLEVHGNAGLAVDDVPTQFLVGSPKWTDDGLSSKHTIEYVRIQIVPLETKYVGRAVGGQGAGHVVVRMFPLLEAASCGGGCSYLVVLVLLVCSCVERGGEVTVAWTSCYSAFFAETFEVLNSTTHYTVLDLAHPSSVWHQRSVPRLNGRYTRCALRVHACSGSSDVSSRWKAPRLREASYRERV